jgi:hypothetical protein
MPSVKLRFSERDWDDLPEVCLKCGDRATILIKKTFTWCPRWANALEQLAPLPFMFITMAVTERVKLAVPMCDKHKHYWLWRTLTIIGLFGALLLLVLVAIFATVLRSRLPVLANLVPILWIGCVLGFVVCLILSAVLGNTKIHAREINDRFIILEGVANKFVDAYENERDPRVDLDRAAGEYWHEPRDRPRREDDSWDENPRRRRPGRQEFRDVDD